MRAFQVHLSPVVPRCSAVYDVRIFKFRESHRRREMYIGHARLSVCLCVYLSVPRRMPTLLHGSGYNLGEW